MPGKRFKAEEIVNKLRQADVELARGSMVAAVCKLLGITDATYFRWRKEYGGMKVDQAKRLKALDQENARLKRLRPERRDHVWAYDFVLARTHEGLPLRLLVVVDEWTRGC